MNAKEFAHKLEKAASFIRQQQAEIEALKQIIDANNLNQNIGQFVKPTNEPVAWMSNGKEFYVQKNYCPDFIPLYTHPVKELTLTRDEIRDVWRKLPVSFTLTPLTIEFARAILRKAQEK